MNNIVVTLLAIKHKILSDKVSPRGFVTTLEDRMKITRIKSLEAVIPTASMADIAFLLIVFFMITTVFQVDKTTVTLPSSGIDTRDPTVKGSAFVVITEDGRIKISNGEEDSFLTKMEDISVYAAGWMREDPEKPVVLKADGTAKYQLVDDVLEQVRQAGVTNLKFLTDERR